MFAFSSSREPKQIRNDIAIYYSRQGCIRKHFTSMTDPNAAVWHATALLGLALRMPTNGWGGRDRLRHSSLAEDILTIV
jgi:hypothetical protein